MTRILTHIVLIAGALSTVVYMLFYWLIVETGTWRKLSLPGMVLLHAAFTLITLAIAKSRAPKMKWKHAFFTGWITQAIALKLWFIFVSTQLKYWHIKDLWFLAGMIVYAGVISSLAALFFRRKKEAGYLENILDASEKE